ncbi:MAG: hypothetical protein EOO11_03010 [Chitinophagaceae bacterium]|nr:MAG: hypothetical protein EOO11_03010 [Chitinophagaceae bacterium]
MAHGTSHMLPPRYICSIAMNDLRLRVLGQLAINAITIGCFYLSSLTEAGIPAWKLLLYVCATTFVVWEALRAAIVLARRLFPGLGRTRLRLGLVTVFTLAITALMPLVKFRFGDLIDLYGTGPGTGPIALYDYLRVMGQNIFYCLFIAAIYEAIYYQALWKELAAETRRLEAARVQGELDVLKAQVNPHFLFNSLNTLSALVRRDADSAERFVEELADVYRYLLEMSREALVPLGAELDFVRAYGTLLAIRFGGHFRIIVDVPGPLRAHRLPPCSLQVLVENAVKHNRITADAPLTLRIEAGKSALLVSNALQPKATTASTGSGLRTLAARYTLLRLPAPAAGARNGIYTVTLPLLAPAYARTDH